MFKKLFMLFKIGRKLSTSGAISSIYEIYKPPFMIKIIFFVIGFNFTDKKKILLIHLENSCAMHFKKWAQLLLN